MARQLGGESDQGRSLKIPRHARASSAPVAAGSDCWPTPLQPHHSSKQFSHEEYRVLAPSQRQGRGDGGWPVSRIPVELFEHILIYLSRADIEHLRLVCKEFEVKLSPSLFKTVVLPFTSELYGVANNAESNNPPKRQKTNSSKGKAVETPTKTETREDEGPLVLQDCGMRIFQGFGHHVNKFGMSFEIDEEYSALSTATLTFLSGTLENPPIKGDQEICHTFWGKYTWPETFYSRFPLCAGLEMTADETHSMAVALSNLTQVVELGLSMDSGLGWLNGPDRSERSKLSEDKPPVFGRTRAPFSTDLTGERQSSTLNSTSAGGVSKKRTLSLPTDLNVFHRQQSVSQSVQSPDLGLRQTLSYLKTVKASQSQESHLDASIAQANPPLPGHLQISPLAAAPGQTDPPEAFLLQSTLPPSTLPQTTNAQGNNTVEDGNTEDDVGGDDNDDDRENEESEDDEESGDDDDDDDVDDDDLPDQPWEAGSFVSADTASVEEVPEGTLLFPKHLSEAQKEWLIETDWAQRAFLSSYIIAMIDNKNTFRNVHSLNIARLPTRHLSLMCRRDLWGALPNLQSLSLFVIPEWRQLSKHGDCFVAAEAIEPSSAVGNVFHLLQHFVGSSPSIQSLRFGWIGGGEHATGIFARNQYLLAAPVAARALDVLEGTKVTDMLDLPRVTHLTLSNCWLSPHALLGMAKKLRRQCLQDLKLVSVSITAPPPKGLATYLDQQAAGVSDLPSLHDDPPFGFDGYHDFSDPLVWLRTRPRPGSWPDLIDALSPGIRLAHLRAEHDMSDAGGQDVRSVECRKTTEKKGLNRLELISCGYTHLADFPNAWPHQLSAIPHLPGPVPPADFRMPPSLRRRRKELAPYMLGTEDPMLGTIVTQLGRQEATILHQAWGVVEGWQRIEGLKGKSKESREDGAAAGGSGRISGVVEKAL
ncbi:MAG: hypothetical protein M1817_003412 [Caeruleum heppii]|nr:MAG: hypothetical protein M1817_003412 [Caeruleum heppii]